MPYLGVKPADITSATEAEIAGDLTVDTNTLKVDATNNRVGINTTSMDAALQVQNGDITVGWADNFIGTQFQDGSAFRLGMKFATVNRTLKLVAETSDNNGEITFETNGSERARVTDNGLTFNGDTAAVNALDDYEEGQWTPNVFNAGYSSNFTTKKGDYIKVGKVVHCWFVCDHGTTNSGSGSGTLTLQGMPYNALTEATSGSTFAMNSTQSVGIWGANPSQQVGNLFTANSATDFLLYMGGSNKTGQLTYVSGHFSYIAQ